MFPFVPEHEAVRLWARKKDPSGWAPDRDAWEHLAVMDVAFTLEALVVPPSAFERVLRLTLEAKPLYSPAALTNASTDPRIGVARLEDVYGLNGLYNGCAVLVWPKLESQIGRHR